MSSFGSPSISRPTTSFCWLPPESAYAATSTPGVRTSNVLDDLRGALAGAAAVDPRRPSRRAAWRLVAEHAVLPQRRRRAAGRRAGGLRGCSRRRARDGSAWSAWLMSTPPSAMRPADGVPQPDERLDELALAVALDAGDADDLAAMHCRATRGRAARRTSSTTVRPATSSSTTSVTVDSRVSGLGSSLPTISSASSRAVTSDGSTDATVRPARTTVMASATASTSSSLWLMKMIVTPSAVELAQRCEELVDLLRHEHRGRLVEDEDAGTAVEHLQDLDPLAIADAEARPRASRGRPAGRRPARAR